MNLTDRRKYLEYLCYELNSAELSFEWITQDLRNLGNGDKYRALVPNPEEEKSSTCLPRYLCSRHCI